MVRTRLLSTHIAAVAAWLGANFVQYALGGRFAAEGAAIDAAWTRQSAWLGRRYYNAAGVLIGITGVLLVLDGGWSWGSGFIWVGAAVVVIGGLMGGLVFVPLSERRAAELDAGEQSAAGSTRSMLLRSVTVDTALVLLAVLAMVDKWQA
ncbi:MAG: hypothetical protein ACK5O2_00555 [Microthrixaceae bacterium]